MSTHDIVPEGPFDTEASILCPHCGASVTIAIDVSSGATQSYVEDCQVCCQPWRLTVRFDDEGAAAVEVEPAY